ncbi:MAG: hypothetical protein JJU00_04665 [Opitutales bacterium]|nr:hypothetical protein [Opitutales bacterium]
MNRGDAIFLAAGAAALLAAGFAALLRAAPPPLPSPPAAVHPPEPRAVAVPDPTPAAWDEPPNQSAGPDWLFEVFTPPIIYFDPERNAFDVTPPRRAEPPPPFALNPVRFERGLYRLQYAAHAGAEGRYIIEIRDEETDTWLRGRVGEHIAEGDFRILDFSVERIRVPGAAAGDTAYVDEVILLEILDERTGETVVLSREPRYEDAWTLVAEGDGYTLSLDEGEQWQDGSTVYTIDSMDPATGQVGVTRRRGDAEPESRGFSIPPDPSPFEEP